MRSGNTLGSRGREKIKVNINVYPVEAHSLRRGHFDNFSRLSFKVGDFIFHNNQSKRIRTSAFISTTFATVFPGVARIVQPVSLKKKKKILGAFPTRLWRSKAIYHVKQYIVIIPWCRRRLGIRHRSESRSNSAPVYASSGLYALNPYLCSFSETSFHHRACRPVSGTWPGEDAPNRPSP